VVRYVYTQGHAESARKRKRNWPPVDIGENFEFEDEQSQYMIRLKRVADGMRCTTENCPNRAFGTLHTSAAANCHKHLMVHKMQRTSNSQQQSISSFLPRPATPAPAPAPAPAPEPAPAPAPAPEPAPAPAPVNADMLTAATPTPTVVDMLVDEVTDSPNARFKSVLFQNYISNRSSRRRCVALTTKQQGLLLRRRVPLVLLRQFGIIIYLNCRSPATSSSRSRVSSVLGFHGLSD
jgi:hypothetical protein